MHVIVLMADWSAARSCAIMPLSLRRQYGVRWGCNVSIVALPIFEQY